jgi:hypothetical protein
MYRQNDSSGKFEIIPIAEDGKFEYLGLAPGKFILKPYPFGNGMQEEISTVTCRAGVGKVYPEKEILGSAISVSKKVVEPTPTITVTPTPTETPRCHYHDGYWKRVCIGHHCFNVWIPGYWHCDWSCNHHDN